MGGVLPAALPDCLEFPVLITACHTSDAIVRRRIFTLLMGNQPSLSGGNILLQFT